METATLLAKVPYGLIGAAVGACVADSLEAEARNVGLQLKHTILVQMLIICH
jgi:hypothetical protein